MVLVDTSVWIRFLAGHSVYGIELARLLDREEVAAHEFIYGELLAGDSGGRKRLLSDYERMWQLATIPHSEVAVFVRERGLAGRGIGWIDIHLLASAVVGRVRLWTANNRLQTIAKEFGLAHDTPQIT